VFIAKGAPEEIFKVCSFYELGDLVHDATDEAREKIKQKYYDLSSEGFRVLGVAYKTIRHEKAVYSVNDENDMVFLGLVAFLDPPKETAKQSLQLLAKEGIELKILTGDNELVTRKTCEELGFEVKGVVLGSEMAQMQDDAFARTVEDANVFARVTPAQKDRIITLLKSNGHVVGFMGDGINDAPSLKTSDVGVSVDNAVDVAKESADIILLKNDLTVLAEGVLEGRRTFGNTMKYVMMGVSSNFGNMFSVAGASIFLPFLPMAPVQILLNNLMYDISQTTITTDSVDEEYVEKPKRWDISFIRRFMIALGPVSSVFDFLTFFIMLLFFNAGGAPLFQTAWFLESLCTQTLVIFVIRTRRSPFYKSKPGKYLVLSAFSIVAAALIIPFTPLGPPFGFVQPPSAFFLILAGLVGTYVVLAQVVKDWFYRRYAYKLEQVLIPKRRALYLSRTARLVQSMVAIISLRMEAELSIDSIIEDLKLTVPYPIDPDQVTKNLQHLRRTGLVSADWSRRTVKREPALREYVVKNVLAGEMWPTIMDDWNGIASALQKKYGRVNEEYRRNLSA
jgi:Mg2+-importing ATPase